MQSNTENVQKPTSQQDRICLKKRLSEHGLTNDRIVRLRDGTKQPTTSHAKPTNRFNADQWFSDQESSHEQDGNYGVYAGDGLLLVDIDDYEDTNVPSSITDLPDTFTVQTPHGGKHRYFVVPEELPEQIEQSIGQKNVQQNWGEVRAHHQYVVGPGSQLDGCNKDWCSSCSKLNSGKYRVVANGPIAELEAERALNVIETVASGEEKTAKSEANKVDSNSTDESADSDYPDDYDPIKEGYSIDEWIDEYALNNDKTLRNLWKGDYATEGYNDRSSPEYALASRLAFWLGPHKDRVRRQMERASPKKWNNRPDESYRENTLDAVDHQEEFYSPPRDGIVESSGIRLPETTSDTQITRAEARQRTLKTLKQAFQSGDEVLVEALPTLGKSYGTIKAAAEIGIPVTILTERRELYEDVQTWCAEHGLESYQLPSMTERCPTHTESPRTGPERRLVDLYERGATPTEVHDAIEALPCQTNGDCPSVNAWDFDPDDYDVLVGYYTQANVTPVIENRVVVIDECPVNAFDTSLQNNLGNSISEFLKSLKCDTDLPDETPTSYAGLYSQASNSDIGRRLQSEIMTVIEQRGECRSESDLDTVTTSTHSQAHRRAPEAAYAVLCDGSEYNGHERVVIDDGTVLLHDPEELSIYVRDPPALDSAQSVVCLDGTPTRQLWESSLSLSFEDGDHKTVLNTAERQSYINDVQGWDFIQTTDRFIYNYTREENVNLSKSATLIEQITKKHNEQPSIISTKACIRSLSNERVIDEMIPSEHYGNLKSSNEFAEHELGVVLGTMHYPRQWICREAAFVGEEIDPQGDGVDKTYNSEYGDALLQSMREHKVLQAAMRFGRDGGVEARVYIHTASFPEWVPRTLRNIEIKTFDGSSRGDVIEAIGEIDPPWTVEDIHDHSSVTVSERQVRNTLNEFCDADIVEKDESIRPHEYYPEDTDANQHGIIRGL